MRTSDAVGDIELHRAAQSSYFEADVEERSESSRDNRRRRAGGLVNFISEAIRRCARARPEKAPRSDAYYCRRTSERASERKEMHSTTFERDERRLSLGFDARERVESTY